MSANGAAATIAKQKFRRASWKNSNACAPMPARPGARPARNRNSNSSVRISRRLWICTCNFPNCGATPVRLTTRISTNTNPARAPRICANCSPGCDRKSSPFSARRWNAPPPRRARSCMDIIPSPRSRRSIARWRRLLGLISPPDGLTPPRIRFAAGWGRRIAASPRATTKPISRSRFTASCTRPATGFTTRVC